MNNILMGLVRWGLSFLAGMMVTRGWITQSQAGEVVQLVLQVSGPLAALGGILWSIKANSRASILKAAASQPEVNRIVVTDPGLVQSIPQPEVVLDPNAGINLNIGKPE